MSTGPTLGAHSNLPDRTLFLQVFRFGIGILLLLCTCESLVGGEETATRKATLSLPFVESLDSLLPDGQSIEKHPLFASLLRAYAQSEFVFNNVRDCTFTLVKRERIKGILQPYRHLKVRVRYERIHDGRIVDPFSIYLHYLGPANIKDRKILFINGTNDGKLRVRKGGPRFGYIKLNMSLDGEAAKRESFYPLTDISLDGQLKRLIGQAESDIRADPTGQNTKVTLREDAKVNQRPCTHIRIVHPKYNDAFVFHIANVYIDDELELPIRFDGYDWPNAADDEPRLKEEFTFLDLKLNVGLTDADFHPDLLK